MRYTAAFRLRGPLAGAVAVEWTDADAPEASNAGWEACVRLPNGDWRFGDHDPEPAAQANWRAPGVFGNIGLRYRLTASGPWSPVSTTRKAITLVGSGEEPVVGPALVTAPTLAGSGKVGAAVSVAPGSWSGAPSPALTLAWCRDGAPIEGATGESYTPVAADDRRALSCRVTATNAGGSAVAETAALPVTRVAPVAVGTLADLVAPLDSGMARRAAAGAFTGEGLSYAVAGAEATIDAAGVVSLPTAALLAAVPVTVTATNSGGSAQAGFTASVVAVAPALATAPTLAGTGKIGAAVSVAAGSWSGKPAPVLALQWCRDGAEIKGATGASYTPVAADDRTALSCRVTATNAGGSAVAATAALAVTRVAPVAVGTLADVTLVQGAAAGNVAAAPAFTGGGLAFAVSGGGATVDAATGVVSLPTGTLRSGATVTVTASNSGGTASASFKLSVVGKEQGVTVSSRAALLAAIAASSAGDVIRIAPGVYDRFVWPKNTSHKLTLAPADVDNPPIMRGIWISQNPDAYFPAQSPVGSWARNLTIDGLRFQAELITRMRQADGKLVTITDEDGRGYGWRADYSYPGVTVLNESAGFVGIKLGSGCSDILVQNCLFEQFAKGMNVQCDRATVQHCEFSEICEDAVIIWGGEDLTFQYNVWTNSRGVSLQAAQAYGWKNDEPVHQDVFQIACNSASQFCTRLNISYNVINDDSERVHGLLLNNAYVGGSTAANLQGSRHKAVTVENNFLKVTHTTALQLTNVVGLTARRNKVIRSRVVAGSSKNDVAIVVGAWGSIDAQNCDDVTVQNNVSRKYKGPWKDSWVWTGNVETNDETVLPAGWVEIRPELVKSGRRAGRYGNPG